MKKITALILTILMLCSVLPLAASAEAYFPALTETPTVVYAWEETYEEGTSLHCMIRNSAEIVKLWQDIRKADGKREYFQTLGYEDAELSLHIQIAYSFNGGDSWVNDFGEDIMGTDYYPNIESEDAPYGLGKYEAAPIPGVEEALYQSADIFNLRNYHPEWYTKERTDNVADYMTQGHAFYVGDEHPDDPDPYYGYAVDFNKNTVLIKARYVVQFRAEGIEAKRVCGAWGNTFTFNNTTSPDGAGFDAKFPSKYNTPKFELLTVFEDDDENQNFLFGITADAKLAKFCAEHAAVYDSDADYIEKFYGEDTIYGFEYKTEIRLNGGAWHHWGQFNPDYIFFDVSDWRLKEDVEYIFGKTPVASDAIEVRICLLPDSGAEWNEDTGCYVRTNDIFAYTDYSAPVRIPMNGLYYIHYDTNYGSFKDDTEQLREFGKSSTAVVDLTSADYIPEKEGYEFGGWYYDEAFTKPATSVDTSVKCDTTVYAKWLGDEYTITYDLGGIDAYNPNPGMYTPLMENIKLDDAGCDGVVFRGWSYTKGGAIVTEIDVKQAKNLTLYANWDFPTFTITYELNGGTNASANPKTAQADKTGKCTVSLAAPTKAGYTFDGWYFDKTFKEPLTKSSGKWTANIAKDTTVYAKWIKGRWNVNYVLPAALKGLYNPNPANYTYGDTVTLKALEANGYTFDGWYTDAAFTAKAASPAVKATDTGVKTFYAKFTEKSYKITYNVDIADAGKYFSNPNPGTRLGSQAVVLKDLTPVSPVYKFLGWYGNVNFDGSPVKEITAGTAKSITLYGKVFKYLWGDVDFDGKVSAADARLVLRQSVGLEHLAKDQIAWGNLDAPGDGKLSAADARLVLRVSVGLDSAAKLNLPAVPPELEK